MNDQELVKRVLQDDQQAIRQLIDQYQRLVVHTVARLIDDDQDREELCQDVFMKIFQNLVRFKFDSKLSTWIVTIAYRLSINFLKKQKKRRDTQDLDKIAFQVGTSDSRVEDEDFAIFIHRLIRQMPEQYRVVLTLYHLDGFAYPEIVKITGMPEGTVKNYLFRARKKLKELSEPFVGTEIHNI